MSSMKSLELAGIDFSFFVQNKTLDVQVDYTPHRGYLEDELNLKEVIQLRDFLDEFIKVQEEKE